MKFSPLAAALAVAPALADVTTYDDLPEGFLGSSFVHRGVSYSGVNDVGGSFPNGDTFTAQDIGDNFIIENSTYLFNDYPAWGSAPNTLTFGTAYIPGPNLSLGAFARATMDLEHPAASAAVAMVFYENGPWGGIVFHLDGIRGGQVRSSATYTINNGGGRDRIAFTSLSVADPAGIETLRLYATWNGGYSAPRLMIDNLTIEPAAPSCPADFNGDAFLDFFDYLDFVGCFEDSRCPAGRDADFNADGFVDFFDYGDFVAAFEAGC